MQAMYFGVVCQTGEAPDALFHGGRRDRIAKLTTQPGGGLRIGDGDLTDGKRADLILGWHAASLAF